MFWLVLIIIGIVIIFICAGVSANSSANKSFESNSQIDDMIDELVSIAKAFQKVRSINDMWTRRFNFNFLEFSMKGGFGSSKDIYYTVRIKLDKERIIGVIENPPNGNKIFKESRQETINHWNSEAKMIAPQFKIVKEYEEDYEIRCSQGEDYNYYLEAQTNTKIKLHHLSYDKTEELGRYIKYKVRKAMSDIQPADDFDKNYQTTYFSISFNSIDLRMKPNIQLNNSTFEKR